MKDKICIDGKELDVLDLMNPPGIFIEGKRQREWSRKDLLPLSGKLIPEFDRRRNIGDMFARKPSLPKSQSTMASTRALEDSSPLGQEPDAVLEKSMLAPSPTKIQDSDSAAISTIPPPLASRKRSIADASTNKPLKRTKSGPAAKTPPTATKGQQSLKGFLKFTTVSTSGSASDISNSLATPSSLEKHTSNPSLLPAVDLVPTTSSDLKGGVVTASLDSQPRTTPSNSQMDGSNSVDGSPSTNGATHESNGMVHDPVESKESWTKLFTKPAAPRCEGHNEPCITLLTKKSGMNNGRSFWMCPRPIGPSGAKEKNTQWRCQTFIWCSDWNPNCA